MKEKLRKHRYSLLFSIGWSLFGLFILGYIAIRFFPFIDSGNLLEATYPILLVSGAGYLLLSISLVQLRSHPTATRGPVVNFIATAIGLLVFMVLAAARVYFSLGFLTVYILFTNLWFSIEFFLREKLGNYTLVLVPGGYELVDDAYPNYRFVRLEEPADLPDQFDAILIDFERKIPEKWLSFASRCILEGVPLVSMDDFVESVKGRIILDHITTGRTLAFQRSPLYLVAKRIVDLAIILLVSPIWIPIMIAAAIAIKAESRGPLIFKQKRMGKGGKAFTIYKFRSMRPDSESGGAAFAEKDDERVTRVGSFIRKYRIDELPQFYNIVRGEMSLIGPRPEQVPFVERFESSIPYYQLRHIVRPGITGWAQVTSGYAADEVATSEKLSADLYYVKHVSFSLDALIAIKTVGTILTGFGAR